MISSLPRARVESPPPRVESRPREIFPDFLWFLAAVVAPATAAAARHTHSGGFYRNRRDTRRLVTTGARQTGRVTHTLNRLDGARGRGAGMIVMVLMTK